MVEITLYHGDCLEVMKEIPAQSVDLIICDLPYGCLIGGAGKEKAKRTNKVLDLRYNNGKTKPLNTYGGAGKEKSKQMLMRSDHPDRPNNRSIDTTLGGCAWDVKIDLDLFWKEIRRIRKNDHTPTIHFCTTKFGFDLIESNRSEFRYDLVWNKQRGVSFLTSNKMPMRSHEMIYVFSKAGAYYNRIDMKGDFKKWNVLTDTSGLTRKCYSTLTPTNIEGGDGTRCVLSVIECKKSNFKAKHPTEKPADIYKWLIERYCPVGGTVLDPTFGSGNSVFTAYTMGRNAIGIEKDDAFFEQAVERLNAL